MLHLDSFLTHFYKLFHIIKHVIFTLNEAIALGLELKSLISNGGLQDSNPVYVVDVESLSRQLIIYRRYFHDDCFQFLRAYMKVSTRSYYLFT